MLGERYMGGSNTEVKRERVYVIKLCTTTFNTVGLAWILIEVLCWKLTIGFHRKQHNLHCHKYFPLISAFLYNLNYGSLSGNELPITAAQTKPMLWHHVLHETTNCESDLQWYAGAFDISFRLLPMFQRRVRLVVLQKKMYPDAWYWLALNYISILYILTNREINKRQSSKESRHYIGFCSFIRRDNFENRQQIWAMQFSLFV